MTSQDKPPVEREGSKKDATGIVILDGGLGLRTIREGPRLRAFVYGEASPPSPTLPFGRWKAAS